MNGKKYPLLTGNPARLPVLLSLHMVRGLRTEREYMDNIVTSDLSEFGTIELEEMENLLMARREQGFPEEFYDDGIQILFNKNSGYVFFTNSEYQVCMLNGDQLEMFYSCPNCGNEGFDGDYPFKKNDGYCSRKCKNE